MSGNKLNQEYENSFNNLIFILFIINLSGITPSHLLELGQAHQK